MGARGRGFPNHDVPRAYLTHELSPRCEPLTRESASSGLGGGHFGAARIPQISDLGSQLRVRLSRKRQSALSAPTGVRSAIGNNTGSNRGPPKLPLKSVFEGAQTRDLSASVQGLH